MKGSAETKKASRKTKNVFTELLKIHVAPWVDEHKITARDTLRVVYAEVVGVCAKPRGGGSLVSAGQSKIEELPAGSSEEIGRIAARFPGLKVRSRFERSPPQPPILLILRFAVDGGTEWTCMHDVWFEG